MPQRTLLVVDDQPSVCTSLAYLLEYAGYKVVTAESGSAAIILAETAVIDGALIDVHMPRMNGFDTCLRLQEQAQSRGQPLRVWFITGACADDFERRSAELGALGVLRKPFDPRLFLAQLEQGFAPLVPPASEKLSAALPR